MLEDLIEQYPDEDLMFAEGLDKGIIGVEEKTFRIIYSMSKIIDILKERDGMSTEEACEFYYFNIEGTYLGEKTPIFCSDYF